MKEKMTFEEFKAEIKRRIKERNGDLESLFNTREYENMPGEFTLKTRLVTHEGEVIPGKDSENYWRKVGDELKGTNLKFKDKYFDAMELTLPPEPRKHDIDFVALEITEFSFEAMGQQYKGYIDPSYRHRVRCTIED